MEIVRTNLEIRTNQPTTAVRAFLISICGHHDRYGSPIHWWRCRWVEHTVSRWSVIPESSIRSRVFRFLNDGITLRMANGRPAEPSARFVGEVAASVVDQQAIFQHRTALEKPDIGEEYIQIAVALDIAEIRLACLLHRIAQRQPIGRSVGEMPATVVQQQAVGALVGDQ